MDLGSCFKEVFFEYNSDKKYFKIFNEHISKDTYFSIEINQDILIILKLKKYDFDLYIENGKCSIDEYKKIISQFYGYFMGYIEGFIQGYYETK